MFPFTEMYLKYVHLSYSFNHSLPEMMYLWWLKKLSGVLPLCYTIGNGVSTCSRLIMNWISHGYVLYILWMSADFCPEFNLDMSQGEVSFLAPKISLWRAKQDTSFWDIAICRFYKLHKRLRVKALSLSIFCHFDEVILNFWWAIEETKCAGHMQLVCCFENVVIIVLQKGMVFGWKSKNQTA